LPAGSNGSGRSFRDIDIARLFRRAHQKARRAINAYRQIGVEHALWCKSQGMTPGEALAALGVRVPLLPNWTDVAIAAAAAERDLRPP
jgi:hypothetical protein